MKPEDIKVGTLITHTIDGGVAMVTNLENNVVEINWINPPDSYWARYMTWKYYISDMEHNFNLLSSETR